MLSIVGDQPDSVCFVGLLKSQNNREGVRREK